LHAALLAGVRKLKRFDFYQDLDSIYEVLLFFVVVGQLGTEKHYIVKYWPAREDFVPRRMLPWWTHKDASASTTYKAGAYEELCESLGQQW
jgi:hypothetical protein